MMGDLFDTPAYKLVRRGDPQTSREAAEQLDVSKMERKVLAAITTFGAAGCISDEVLELLHNDRYSTVTARYKQLKEKGLIVTDDRKRKANSGRQQLVMWAKDFYKPAPE